MLREVIYMRGKVIIVDEQVKRFEDIEGGVKSCKVKGEVGIEETGPSRQLGAGYSRRFPWPWWAQPKERLTGAGRGEERCGQGVQPRGVVPQAAV